MKYEGGVLIQIISQTHFFRALRIFMDTPHCTQVLMGLGQPFPFTVIPSSSSLYAFTSGFITTSQTGSVSRVARVEVECCALVNFIILKQNFNWALAFLKCIELNAG